MLIWNRFSISQAHTVSLLNALNLKLKKILILQNKMLETIVAISLYGKGCRYTII